MLPVIMDQVAAFLLGLPKALAGMSEGEIQDMSRALSEFDSNRLTPWQATQIYHTLTQQKTVVSSKKFLQLVCLALDHILGGAVDVPKSDKQNGDLYMAMDALAPSTDESVEGVFSAEVFVARQGSKAASVLAGTHGGC